MLCAIPITSSKMIHYIGCHKKPLPGRGSELRQPVDPDSPGHQAEIYWVLSRDDTRADQFDPCGDQKETLYWVVCLTYSLLFQQGIRFKEFLVLSHQNGKN